MRSTDQLILEVPRTKYELWGGRAFAVFVTKIWKMISPEMPIMTDPALFKPKLKTYLFKMVFNTKKCRDILHLFYVFFCFLYVCFIPVNFIVLIAM